MIAGVSQFQGDIKNALRIWNLGKESEWIFGGGGVYAWIFSDWYIFTVDANNKPDFFPFQEHLVFTVCLSYQYSGLEDTVEDKQEVNVGKPLIAKLDMHRGLGRKTCFQTCLMSNGPYQSSAATSGGAGHYHSLQDPFHGVYHSHPGNPSNVTPADSCHCSRTPDAFISSFAHHSSCHFSRSNVPVETTDEIPFSFSDRLRISEKWPPCFWKLA